MITRQRVMSALLGLVCSSALYCNASVIYSNDFQSREASGWSVNGNSSGVAYSVVPKAASGYGSFLGQYGAGDNVGFSYKNSALLNSRVTLSFSFFAIRSWDGNDTLWGKDFFKVVANNSILLDNTFSNGWATQSFTRDGLPANGSNDAPMAGSSQQYALGYRFWDGINGKYWYQDAVYQLTFAFDSLSDLLNLNFVSSGLQKDYVNNDPDGTSYLDESWGLDNITLSVVSLASSVPEPTTVALVILGLLASARSLRIGSSNSTNSTGRRRLAV